ncbi:response regulator [Rapidithrix thailandica]|uniref:Response regulator n=1 Tax=Rapidithrix thailandica TaxID=413964 RepID=A0AAW9S1C7_9BACT
MEEVNHIEVVFIEDSLEDSELTLRSLRKYKLANRLKVIDDGQKAVEYLFGDGQSGESITNIPKLILLDLKLPKVSGLEILERMKKEPRFKDIPVVVLTSSNESIDIKKAYELGANSYIVKPVDFAKFTEAIQQVGMYWLLLNQPPKNNIP